MPTKLCSPEFEQGPAWIPDAVRTYLSHTQAGWTIRALARRGRCHPSTVLRRVRRIENRRDDRLIDDALRRIAGGLGPATTCEQSLVKDNVMAEADTLPEDDQIECDARRALRRMAEPGACLALADGMDMAVVVREADGGETMRTTSVTRAVAEAMALRDWIAPGGGGRILRYRITAAGRAALKRLVAEEESRRMGSAGQGSDADGRYGTREISEGGEKRRVRYNMNESPLVALSRRRDKSGEAFLSDALVAAGERLREDFELAQMGPRVAQNWERFLTGGARGGFDGGTGPASGPGDARRRVMDALSDLGPGLGDVALRCCCFLEGLEATEQRMGWSARSGKIVLRIALQRLRRHYDEKQDGWSPLIG
ncbi:MAG: DUF6456 domain-containing protein [Pseudomonadota bacterium]